MYQGLTSLDFSSRFTSEALLVNELSHETLYIWYQRSSFITLLWYSCLLFQVPCGNKGDTSDHSLDKSMERSLMISMTYYTILILYFNTQKITHEIHSRRKSKVHPLIKSNNISNSKDTALTMWISSCTASRNHFRTLSRLPCVSLLLLYEKKTQCS